MNYFHNNAQLSREIEAHNINISKELNETFERGQDNTKPLLSESDTLQYCRTRESKRFLSHQLANERSDRSYNTKQIIKDGRIRIFDELFIEHGVDEDSLYRAIKEH